MGKVKIVIEEDGYKDVLNVVVSDLEEGTAQAISNKVLEMLTFVTGHQTPNNKD